MFSAFLEVADGARIAREHDMIIVLQQNFGIGTSKKALLPAQKQMTQLACSIGPVLL